MDAQVIVRWAKTGSFRGAACVALLSVSLAACSSVPAALNPVKWYEKTTDFFSGDRQASDMQIAKNNGLAADPEAPAPAEASVQNAPAVGKGLNADQVSSNYASPPLERQGAPTSVLQPFVPPPPSAATAPIPPAPVAQPTVSVASSPISPPSSVAPVAPVVRSQVPVAPVAVAKVQALNPKRITMAGAPPPPKFNLSSAASPSASLFGGDTFETVVISSDGMATASAPRPKLNVSAAPQTSVRFPGPGTTVRETASLVRVGSRMRAATINFANNSSSLDARDRSILGAVIQLQRERGGHVVVVGHASSRTKDMDYITHKMVNFQISMQRAATIGNALKDLGLQGENLEIQAVSDREPLYTEVMPSGEAANRRVEIYLAP